MKLKPFLLMLCIIILGDACFFHTLPPTMGPATLSPAATLTVGVPPTSVPATAVPSPTIPSAILPIPVATLTPAAVPSRLDTDGPYLAYLRDAESGLEIVLMDANGKGELSAAFPMELNSSLPPLLSNLLSSDGDWLAFYTGSAGPAFGQSGPDASDLTLKLMDLFSFSMPTGDSKLVTRLLSADYPANFATAASQLGMEGVTAQALRDSFVAGITQSIAWSPDGTQLAFAGQMDGLSSDLYLYDAGSQAIQRLSSGPQEVEWIDWSPDGKWILDGSVYFVGEGMTYDVYATSRDGKVTRKLLSDYMMDVGVTWINGREFLTYQNENGPGNYGLERVNVETGKIDKIWESSFSTFLPDPQGDWLAVLTQGGDEMTLVNLATLQQTVVTLPGPVQAYGPVPNLIAMDSGADRHFILRQDTGSDWYYLSTSGALTDTGFNADLVSIAPDQGHWITMKDDLQLFSNAGTRIATFTLPPGMQAGDFKWIIWRPDSSGIFLVSTSSQLYSLDYSTGEYELVEQHLATTGPAGLIWVH
jgi:hypothetical protein